MHPAQKWKRTDFLKEASGGSDSPCSCWAWGSALAGLCCPAAYFLAGCEAATLVPCWLINLGESRTAQHMALERLLIHHLLTRLNLIIPNNCLLPHFIWDLLELRKKWVGDVKRLWCDLLNPDNSGTKQDEHLRRFCSCTSNDIFLLKMAWCCCLVFCFHPQISFLYFAFYVVTLHRRNSGLIVVRFIEAYICDDFWTHASKASEIVDICPKQ